jgi:hypothetical protein
MASTTWTFPSQPQRILTTRPVAPVQGHDTSLVTFDVVEVTE